MPEQTISLTVRELAAEQIRGIQPSNDLCVGEATPKIPLGPYPKSTPMTRFRLALANGNERLYLFREGKMPQELRVNELAFAWLDVADVKGDPHRTCPWCKRTTYNANDVAFASCPCCGDDAGVLPKDCEHRRAGLAEEDRQIVILALASLVVERPGWANAIERIADGLKGRVMYDKLVKIYQKEATVPEIKADDDEVKGAIANLSLGYLVEGIIMGAASRGVIVTPDEVREALAKQPDDGADAGLTRLAELTARKAREQGLPG